MSRICVSAAAVCALLAAPASGQDGPRGLEGALHGLAETVSALLAEEADRAGDGETIRVTFRSGSTSHSALDIYCRPLSDGLRMALHGRVEYWRRKHSHGYETMLADDRKVTPPEVTPTWSWDPAEKRLRVGALVLLPGERLAPVDGVAVAMAALDSEQRKCLFAFRQAFRSVEAGAEGILRYEPTLDPRRIARFFAAGETFYVVGDLTSLDGHVWQVVQPEDPGMDRELPLFTAELAGGAAVQEPDDEAPRVVLPAARQESALRERINDMARNIAGMLNEEANRRDERLRVSLRPARTVQAGMDIYCGPLSSGLRHALHERVQWHSEDMRMNSFDLAVADARAVEPPDVTMSWAWDGADKVSVEAHVLLSGDRGHRGARYSASLPVSGLGERERACLFAFRPGGGKAEAKTAGILREEPSFDPAGIVRRFEAGEKLLVAGELSSAGENGVVWSVVLGEDETGGFRNLFAAELASGRGGP